MIRMLLVTTLLLAGCSLLGPDTDEYARGPAFVPTEFYNGPINAWGTVADWRGTVTRRFTAAMQGDWTGDAGTLAETFRYDDGTVYQRTWNLTKIDADHFTGTAPNVIGTAIGERFGNALRWQYDTRVPQEKPETRVHFDHWIWAMDDAHVMNRITVTKFGIPVGEVTIFMQKSS